MKKKTKATEALSRQPIVVDLTALYCCCLQTSDEEKAELIRKLSLMSQGGDA